MKWSTAALGLAGGAAFVGVPRLISAQAKSATAGPGDDYPWSVEVDGPAQVAMYLIQNLKLNKLLVTDELYQSLEYMQRRLDRASSDDRKDITAALQKKGHTISELETALSKAVTDVKESVTIRNAVVSSYEEYAIAFPVFWDTKARASLESLDGIIPVPVLHTNRSAANDLYREHGPDLKKFAAGRELEDLFVNPHDHFRGRGKRKNELQVWRHARDAGLLWCAARGSHRLRDTSGQPYYHDFEDPNGLYCNPNTGKCEDRGNSQDYCQMVDGTCNGMGT